MGTGTIISSTTIPPHSRADVEGAFERASVAAGTWRDNPRIRLAAKSIECGDVLLLDAYLSEVQAYDSEETKREITRGGYVKEAVRYVLFGKYRYLIDIDGNASSWGFFWKLNFSGVVLKVESDFMQWFYPDLSPGEHYLQVKRDLSDLVDQIRWARTHDEECRVMHGRAKQVIRTHSIEETRRRTGLLLVQVLGAQIAA